MNSFLLHQKANELVQRVGSRDICSLTEATGLQIHEIHSLKDALGFFTFHWDQRKVYVSQKLDDPTRQMVCGYALSRYMEAAHAETASHPRIGCVLQGHLSEYHSNALSSHLLLDSEEVYHLTTLGYDAAQIADHTKHHLHLILVKLLELYHMGFDFAHYHETHHRFLGDHQHLAHFCFGQKTYE